MPKKTSDANFTSRYREHTVPIEVNMDSVVEKACLRCGKRFETKSRVAKRCPPCSAQRRLEKGRKRDRSKEKKRGPRT